MDFIIKLLDLRMQKPDFYSNFSNSWFHYLSLLLTFLSFIYLMILFRKSSTRKIKRTLLILGIVMLLFEVYKQFIFTYQAGSYQWYTFPFQFCSTPMYLYVIYGLSKNDSLDRYLHAFLATYATFAGLAVMLYPQSVFVDTIGINIQTMVHHGLMASVGLALLFSKPRLTYKDLFKAMFVFIMLIVIAYTLNTLFDMFIHDGVFNMFFISPKFGTGLPILSLIQPRVPSFVFLVIYTLGFSLMAVLILNIKYLTDNFMLKLSALK